MQLNLEQKKLVNLKPNGHILVKGVAGSGKTTVAVKRLPFLAKNYCYEHDDKVLLLTYNKTLINYIKHLYNKSKEEEEEQLTFDNFIGDYSDKIVISTLDKIIYDYFVQWKQNFGQSIKLITKNDSKFTFMSQSISEVKKQYPNVKLIDQQYINFLLDEIEWIKACNYNELSEYQNVDRLGRTSKQNIEGPQRILKNSETREAIFELMQVYNRKLKENNLIDFKDMALIVLDYLKSLSYFEKYTHIIVDESQDLTRVQLEIVSLLYNHKPYSSLMFVADIAQSIYNHSWLVKGRSFTSIGYDMTGKSHQLSKNYRTTVQIAKCAYSLISKDPNIIDDENYVAPSHIDKQGSLPVLKMFKNMNDEAYFVYNQIQKLKSDYDLKDIVVISKTKKYLEEISIKLNELGLENKVISKEDSDFEGDNVKLITMHSIKGLEFKVVFIVGLNKKIIPSNITLSDEYMETIERKLLYVAMTRANELLYLSCSESPSKFIKDIDHEFLLINPDSKIKCFREVHTDNYLFTNKINNVFSKEESIRQWIIHELINTYKYPLELIDVEYKVNSFSKIGSVDIVVFIYKNGIKKPFIFIETKSLDAPITSAKSQLLSYMSSVPSCSYGVVSNGLEFVVVDRYGDEVSDIPCFNVSMLPTGIETYEFIDYRYNKKCIIKRNINDDSTVAYVNNGVENSINTSECTKLNIYSKIAAGNPTTALEEPIDSFFMPNEIIDSNNYFVMVVKGDSMIEAGIDDGDLVVLKSSNHAENREIVAVSLDGECTLKRLVKMGDFILLMPENKNYEPIPLNDKQARIIGIAVGIIKKVPA